MIWQAHHNFVEEVVTSYIKLQIPVGGTQKESARLEGVYMGQMTGFRESLAFYANEQRYQMTLPYQIPGDNPVMVPSTSGHKFEEWLRNLRKRWNEGAFEKVEDDDFFRGVHAQFEAVAFDDNFKKLLGAMRRDAVKAGVVDPTKDDMDWLTEEYEQLNTVAKPLADLIKKVRGETE